jgi:cell wall-associated NlpC family hydrolase
MTINTTTIPDLAALVEPLLGLPYEQYDCWRLVRRLYRDYWGEDLEDNPAQAWKHVQEIWWQDDAEDPLVVSQSGDLWIMRGLGLSSHHVGVVCNTVHFVHARKRVGTCLEPLRVWRPRLLQIARLRRLAS